MNKDGHHYYDNTHCGEKVSDYDGWSFRSDYDRNKAIELVFARKIRNKGKKQRRRRRETNRL